MITRLTLAAAAALALLACPAAASPGSGWSSQTDAGSVVVSADHKHITVCDLATDGHSVEAEYGTSMLGIYTVTDDNGPWSGCGSERTYLSRIDVFKLCVTGGGPRQCQDAVWIERR